MKVTFEREKLLSAFQTVTPVVPSRSPKPILQNIKLEVGKDTAYLMGTDLEIGIRVEVQGLKVDKAGSAILPTGRFGSILRESSDEKLELETDEKGVAVRGDRSNFRLPGHDPQEFPAIVSFNETRYHQLPGRLLREIVRRTVFATDNESSRYALGGVLIEFGAKKIEAIGTDGRRMAVVEAPAQAVGGHETIDTPTIIPSRAMTIIERAMGDQDADVMIAARGSDVLVKSPRATIYSRLVEGRFPRWRDVFPKRTDVQKIDFVVGPLLSAVRQAAIVTGDEQHGVNFTFGDGQLTLQAQAAEYGESRVQLPISYAGKQLAITLDHRFVVDFLRVLDPEKSITVELEDNDSAAVCSTDDGYRYVIMPLSRE